MLKPRPRLLSMPQGFSSLPTLTGDTLRELSGFLPHSDSSDDPPPPLVPSVQTANLSAKGRGAGASAAPGEQGGGEAACRVAFLSFSPVSRPSAMCAQAPCFLALSSASVHHFSAVHVIVMKGRGNQ